MSSHGPLHKDPARSFGGFIGLEEPAPGGGAIHTEGHLLSSGRACLSVILRELHEARRVHIPFYTCDSALLPFREQGIEILEYALGHDLMPILSNDILSDDIVVLNDTYGILGERITALGSSLRAHVVHDDTHTFHTGRRSPSSWSFNSARKFCGVPDGAYLFAPSSISLPPDRNDRVSADHLVLKWIEADQEAYLAYRRNEEGISTVPQRASLVSEIMLSRMDHHTNATQRQKNFLTLHESFGMTNGIDIGSTVGVPYCYPYLPLATRAVDRTELYRAGLFIPTLWEDVLSKPDEEDRYHFEKELSRSVLALPIDQRYSETDMLIMARRLQEVLGR